MSIQTFSLTSEIFEWKKIIILDVVAVVDVETVELVEVVVNVTDVAVIKVLDKEIEDIAEKDFSHISMSVNPR